jgi:CHAT domain-containing protein
MRIKTPHTCLLILFLLFSINSFTKGLTNPINVARQLIEAGNLKDGKKILAAIKNGNNENDFNKYILNSEIAINQRELELFKSYTDSAYYCLNHSKLPAIYLALVYRNYSRYYHYNILVDNAEKYADSALTIFRQNYKNKDLIPVFTLFQAKASVLRNKPKSKNKVNLFFDTAFYWLNKQKSYSAYSKYILTRSYGNFLLDGLNDPIYLKNINEDSLFTSTLNTFKNCAVILRRELPKNKSELANIYSLQAICWFIKKDYKEAYHCLERSLKLLEDLSKGEAEILETYYTCLNYQNSILEKVLSVQNSIKYREKYLSKLIPKEKAWIEWTFKNRNKQTGVFRLMYSSNYYSVVLDNAYYLYKQTKNKKYKNLFFHFLERSKTLFFADKIEDVLDYQPHLLDTKQFINDSSAYIDYCSISLLYEHKNFAYVNTSKGDTIIELGQLLSEKYEKSFSITDSLFKSFQHFNVTSYEVYKKIVSPIVGTFSPSIKHLIISHSNTTSFINFDYLITDSLGRNYQSLKYLFYAYNIRYLPSLAIKHIQQKSKSKTNNWQERSVFFGTFNGGYHNLPFLSKHAASLVKYNFTRINNNQNRDKQFQEYFQNSELMELVGHCKTTENGYISDYIMEFGDENSNLKASKLLDLKTQCKMIVLALCETGKGELFRSDVGNHIANYFMKAGARSIIYSINKIDDKSTAYILDKYYEFLGEGYLKNEALRKAKFEYLKKSKINDEFCPMYWGGLALQGDIESIQINNLNNNSKFNFTIYFILITLIILMIIAIHFRQTK